MRHDAFAVMLFAALPGTATHGAHFIGTALEQGATAILTDAEGALVLLRFSQANLSAWEGRDILLGIRPEAITDPEGADRKSANIQRLVNRVAVTEPAGSDTFVTMSLGGRDVIARMRADAAVSAGSMYEFAVNMEKALAFDPQTEARILATGA